MAKFTMPEVFKISVAAKCPSHAQTRVTARKHALVIDEPPSRHGTDEGPTPLETMLSSFLGCTNVVANMIADEMGISIRVMELSVTGHFDTRGVFGKADIPIPFPTIELSVKLRSDAEPAKIDALKASLAKRCPIAVILRRSGCNVVEKWEVAC